MTQLPPPATGTELYLAAIHQELRALRVEVAALRVDLSDGGQAQEPLPAAPAGSEDPPTSLPSPTKRARARTPRAD